jgi:hypothetical protein
MCEGYTELAPVVAICFTNMAENKSRRLWLNTTHAQGLQSMLFHSLTLTLFCIVLCFEYVNSWLCELPKLLCYNCGEFMIKKHQRNFTSFTSKVYYS